MICSFAVQLDSKPSVSYEHIILSLKQYKYTFRQSLTTEGV